VECHSGSAVDFRRHAADTATARRDSRTYHQVSTIKCTEVCLSCAQCGIRRAKFLTQNDLDTRAFRLSRAMNRSHQRRPVFVPLFTMRGKTFFSRNIRIPAVLDNAGIPVRLRRSRIDTTAFRGIPDRSGQQSCALLAVILCRTLQGAFGARTTPLFQSCHQNGSGFFRLDHRISEKAAIPACSRNKSPGQPRTGSDCA